MPVLGSLYSPETDGDALDTQKADMLGKGESQNLYFFFRETEQNYLEILISPNPVFLPKLLIGTPTAPELLP